MKRGPTVCDHYKLGLNQGQVDFLDVYVELDTPVAIDPTALRLRDDDWGIWCQALLQDFFQTLLHVVGKGDKPAALALLEGLKEPNDIRLGQSAGNPKGRSIGEEYASKIYDELRDTQAALSGQLEDLEETALLVEGIATDRISDMTANIIREPLIRFTQEMCAKHDLDTEELDSGRIWDSVSNCWTNRFEQLPHIDGKRLLMVPKDIVRKKATYSASDYFNNYILEELKSHHLAANDGLVTLLKSGVKKVYKKSLKERYKERKDVIRKLTKEYPQALKQYRNEKRIDARQALSDEDLAAATNSPLENLGTMMDQLKEIPAGAATANTYHRAVFDVLRRVLYPSLTSGQIEKEINDGRKRIDIVLTNTSTKGFFRWLKENYPPAGFVIGECKNYSDDIKNPELDQLLGRLNPKRGKFGILFCRSVDDWPTLIQRCRDATVDDKYVLVIDDLRLEKLAEAHERSLDDDETQGKETVDSLLSEWFGELVL